jgi:hypothetical protein
MTSMSNLGGRGCDSRFGELCACYEPPVRCRAPHIQLTNLHDRCSSKNAREGASCYAAPTDELTAPLPHQRALRHHELHAPPPTSVLASSSATMSIHPPKQQGGIALQPRVASVCYKCFNYLGWMLQVVLSWCCKNTYRCCICCNTYIKKIYLFQTYIASVLSGCCICFTHICCRCIFQLFQLF